MCIAILKPAEKSITEATLAECFRCNPDGAGFMYSTGDEVKIHKGFFTFASFYKAYQHHANKQLLIHFRIKTHGKVSQENCHPFYVNKKLGFIHNGIISHHSSNGLVSDTRAFNDMILKPLVHQYGTTIITRPAIQSLIAPYIGYSKLVFLDVDGSTQIINENKGVWDDGVWYSNTSYQPYVPPPVVSYSKDIYGRDNNGRFLPRTKYERQPYSEVVENDVYYMAREGSTRISEGDMARVRTEHKGQWVGKHVKVIYISKHGICDIELPNGIVIQNFAGVHLDVLPFQTTFDDTYSDNMVQQGFLGAY